MSQAPVELIIAAFPSETAADGALQDLRKIEKEGQIRIVDAAVLRRDAASKLHIKETADMGGGKGAAIGGTVGAIIGLAATGPIGWAILGGAAVGGLLAKLRDGGFPDAKLREIGESLPPKSSAIIAVVEDRWAQKAEKELQERGAKVVREQLKADIAQQLAAGKEIVYGATVAEGGVAITRVVSDDKSSEMQVAIATGDEVIIASARTTSDPALEGTATPAPAVEAEKVESPAPASGEAAGTGPS